MLTHFYLIDWSHFWQWAQGIDWNTVHGALQSATDLTWFLTALKALSQ
jgi:hypothetical protein